MHWRPLEPNGDTCKCGELHAAHVWICDECGTPAATLKPCGCGAVHLPEPGCACRFAMSLFCPEPARVIDDVEWNEHLRALATYRMIRRRMNRPADQAPTHGRFRTAEAERLRGLSA